MRALEKKSSIPVMRTCNTLIFLVLAFSLPIYAEFFGDTVHTVHVYFDSPSYWTALYATHASEEYIMCDVIFDGVDTLDSVGIRLKGFSSFNHPGNKKPFHLKFDEYIDGQDYRGNGMLSFGNCWNDPTFLREHLGCEIYHKMGVPCSRSCFCVVYYNDVYWGFYCVVDPINKDALTRFFGENDWGLYNCDENAPLTWLGWSESSYPGYEKETNIDDPWTDFLNFVYFLNNSSNADFSAQLLSKFDAVGFARMWAVNTFISNLNSYQGAGSNYLLYFDHDTVAHYIVYDLNMAFGGYPSGMSASGLRTMTINWYSTSSGGRPLARRCFENWSPFWGLVYCALNELLETTLDTATFNARVDELATLVRPYVYADVNKQYSNAAFETNLSDDYSSGGGGGGGMGTLPGLKDFIADRSVYMRSHVTACSRTNVGGRILINEVMPDNDATIADEIGEYEDWIELYNPGDSTVSLSYWWLTDDFDEPRKWYLPYNTTIAAHSYLLIWADRDPEDGTFHTSFKLEASSGEVALFSSDFIGTQFCDSVQYPNMAIDSSWGRYPNGSATWQVCRVATPNAQNTWGLEILSEEDSKPFATDVNIYPNPFNSMCKIVVPDGARVEIFDTMGKIIATFIDAISSAHKNTEATSTTKTYIWRPNKSIPSGNYTVRATEENGQIRTANLLYVK